MNSKQLLQELNQNILTSLYLFIAEDPYIAQSYLRLIRDRFFQQFPELNVTVFDQKQVDGSDVIATCTMLPIMEERRLVIVQTQINKDKELAQILSEYAKHVCDTTTLIIVSQQVDKRISLFKEFSKSGKTVTFSKLNEKELRDWTQKRFLKNKRDIERNALDYLIEVVDYLNKDSVIDLGFVANEIDKLIMYRGEGETITLLDVKAVSTVNINQDIFRLSDSLIAGKIAEAYIQAYKIEYQNTPIQLVIGALASSMRNICICQSELLKGKSEAAIAKEYKIHPYPVKKAIQAKSKFQVRDAMHALQVLQNVDIKIKTGQLNPKNAMSLLIEDIGSKKFLFRGDVL